MQYIGPTTALAAFTLAGDGGVDGGGEFGTFYA